MSDIRLAVVAIGRNEGDRLRKCLASAMASGHGTTVVYVDSGSTDDSVAMAQDLGCEVVNLDMTSPFTAARARNEGFERALQVASDISHVQFVDGDCEIVRGWIDTAASFLATHPEVAAACGRRRERHPEQSIYNQLCDIEWDSRIGQTRYCGGDVMMRADALKAVGGYRPSLIAGEEPELCVRLRAKGWEIWRLDQEMTLHDAAMKRFGQWWNRSKRAGHAFAEGAALHGAYPERHYVREAVRALAWGLLLPLAILLATLWHPLWACLFLAYPLQVVRIASASNLPQGLAWWRAFYLVLGKFPEAQGLLKYWLNSLSSRSATLIEYK